MIGFAPNGHAEIHRPQVWNICLVADVLAQIEKRDMCLFLSRQDPWGLGGLFCCSKKLCTLGLIHAHIHVSYLSLTFFNVESGGFSLNATIFPKLHNLGRAILCAACCHVFPLPSRHR